MLFEAAKLLDIDTDLLHVVVPKLLTSAPEAGRQGVHWDCKGGHLVHNKLSCVLYCTMTHSTALPRFPQNQFVSDNPAELRRNAYLLDPEWYHSVPVFAGELAIFLQHVPHFGVRNRSSQNRVVLFTMLSPSNEAAQDDHQFFRWMFMAEAFGTNSKQFAEALVENKQYSPLQRYYTLSHRKIAEACLRKHQLFTAYQTKV